MLFLLKLLHLLHLQKKGDQEHVSSEETHSDEPIQVPIQNLFKGDDSDDAKVPLSETPSEKGCERERTPKSKKKDVKGKGKAKAEKSKSEKKKKAPIIVSESDSNVEADVQDIVPAEKKKFAGRRIPKNVSTAPLDNVSFHSEENVLKWKYVYQRILAIQREVGSDVLECNCFEKLVKEFVVNLSVEVRLPESDEYRKVYVRTNCVKFSPDVINKVLGRRVDAVADEEPSLDVVTKELTAGKVQKWPKKKLLPTGNLSVKLIYKIGNMIPVDFDTFMFKQTLKHVETCVVKLPISFPSLIIEIILQQHPKIVRDDEEDMLKGAPITLDHRLFSRPHVPDIVVPSSRTFSSALVSKAGRRAVIDELQVVSKAIQETITTSTARKAKVHELLLKLQEEEDQEGEPSAAPAAATDASTDEEEITDENGVLMCALDMW
ncbi:uncharacterized protein LOC130735205 [Lotus japonicus]|uniref:uncharacterized protein LOC130735205 n=1 Tax=Lotus japonicus TaxID=34305 RepID=UPI0025909EE5|nr:uncharacterized protein LOC130735205 [Lotus japonicus]